MAITFVDGQAPALSAANLNTMQNLSGSATNPVTVASAARPTGLTSVWWLTATQPTNWIAGDVWVVSP